MCGIVAMLSSRAIERSRLDAARDALAHRGPDGEGSFISGGIGLAHRRLAIVDPAFGTQPIANEDGSIIVVASGEVYEHERLRAELERRGHGFKTRSDSELLVHLYEEEGAAFVDRLRGELAFALWDARTNRLLVYRDRFGIRPIVWALHDGVLAVASEVKALFAAGVPRRWDEESFFVAASVQYTPPDRTLFEGVRTLPPGCILHASIADERVRVGAQRYADLDYPREGAWTARTPAETRAMLAEAVRLRATSPVAFQLSGGLDSTAVLALAKEGGIERPSAFTLAFDDPSYDESGLAIATCKELAASLTLVDASDANLVAALPPAIAQGEGLAINAHISAKYLLARAIAKAGFKVALSGEGADEVFAGYAHLRRDLGVRDDRNALSVGTMLPSNDAALSLSALGRALGSVPTFLQAKASLGAKLHALFDPRWKPAADPIESVLAAFDVDALRERAPVHRALHLWTRLALATYMLRTLGDGMDLAHAVEVRLPFLDARVFELARDLPPSLLVKDGREKHLLRAAVSDLVPEHVLAREKHPLLAPLVATSEGARSLVGDALASAPRFFDREALARLLDRLPELQPKERITWEPVVMMVLSASILGTHYGLSE